MVYTDVSVLYEIIVLNDKNVKLVWSFLFVLIRFYETVPGYFHWNRIVIKQSSSLVLSLLITWVEHLLDK